VAVASPLQKDAQWPKPASAPCRPCRRGRHEGVCVWESLPGHLQGFTQQKAEVLGQGQPSLVLEGSNQVERSITAHPGRAQGLPGNFRPSGSRRKGESTGITESVRKGRAQTALLWEDEAQQESGRGAEPRSMQRRSGHPAIFGKAKTQAYPRSMAGETLAQRSTVQTQARSLCPRSQTSALGTPAHRGRHSWSAPEAPQCCRNR
jgi:hypothetical protein